MGAGDIKKFRGGGSHRGGAVGISGGATVKEGAKKKMTCRSEVPLNLVLIKKQNLFCD